MKKTLAIFIAAALISCDNNEAPICEILIPENNYSISINDIIQIEVNSEDTDGLIAEVNIYFDDIEDTIFYTQPYSYKVLASSFSVGRHIIRATAIDDGGKEAADTVAIDIEPHNYTYTDGDYRVEYDKLDSHGFKAFLEFKMEFDNISSADYDYVDIDGNLKSEDSAYNAVMGRYIYDIIDGDTIRMNPDRFCKELDSLINHAIILPEYVAIDVVTGATHSSLTADYFFGTGLLLAKQGEKTSTILLQPDP